MDYKVLVINPGSTSTKIAIYENEIEIHKTNIEHSSDMIASFRHVAEQFDMRKEAIYSSLNMMGISLNELSAVVGRGGMLTPIDAGAYLVNEAMIDILINRPIMEHASNLGAILAYEIANPLGVPAFIYDPPVVDQLEDIARISGMPELERRSVSHALNMRAVAIKVASMLGRPYEQMNFVIAHIGGGISVSIHKAGKMVDIVSDDEGPFSPERAGRVPCGSLIGLCYSGKYNQDTMKKKLRGKGGLVAYLGTNNAVEVEKRIADGDKDAELIYHAMAYQIAKSIGELATVVNGQVDRIILTGGLSYSTMLTGWIKEKVEFIAKVEIVPGEKELEALALGAQRVLSGQEKCHIFGGEIINEKLF